MSLRLGSGGQLLPHAQIRTEDVLAELTARTSGESHMGMMLDVAHGGQLSNEAIAELRELREIRDDVRNEDPLGGWWRDPKGDVRSGPGYVTDLHELELLRHAALIRCIDDLFRSEAIGTARDEVRTLSRASGLAEGTCVVCVLRAFQEWGTAAEDRGYVAVYTWLRGVDARTPILLDPRLVGFQAAQAFRENRERRCRDYARRIVLACLGALGEWVVRWNRQEAARRAEAAK